MAKTKDTKIRLPGTKVHSGQVTLHPYISTRLHSVGLDGQDHMLMILLKCISKEISLTIYIRIFFRCCYCTICCNIYLLENIEHELFFQFVLWILYCKLFKILQIQVGELYLYTHKFANSFIEKYFLYTFLYHKGYLVHQEKLFFSVLAKKAFLKFFISWAVTGKFMNLILNFQSFSWDLWTQIKNGSCWC